MTKRFDYTNYDDGTESIYDRKKDVYYFDCEFCKLDEVLNQLNDESEQLRKENKELRQYLGWQDMELEEMEDLKRCSDD